MSVPESRRITAPQILPLWLFTALTFIFTLMYVVARFVLEVLYLLLDPRVRYSG